MEDTEETDQIDVCWVDENWVNTWGLGAHNVLDYFACSQFYDLSCNNEILKMQNKPVTIENLSKLSGIEYILERSSENDFDLNTSKKLTAKSTINTSITLHEPFLFVITKQLRHKKSEESSRKEKEGQDDTSNDQEENRGRNFMSDVTRLNRYYVLDKVIYQAPSLKSLFNSRVDMFCFHINNALEFLQKAHRYTPQQTSLSSNQRTSRNLQPQKSIWKFPDHRQTKAWNRDDEDNSVFSSGASTVKKDAEIANAALQRVTNYAQTIKINRVKKDAQETQQDQA